MLRNLWRGRGEAGKRTARGERGTAAVELALLLPVLIVIVCGALDFSRAFYAYVSVASTAHEAARFAARYPGGQVTPSALQTVVAGESGGLIRLVASPASGGNATLAGPALYGTDEQVVSVTLTYQFQPITGIPLAGPIAIAAGASAPTGGAGGMATSTPAASPTATVSPTMTRTPTPVPSSTPTTVPSPTATPCTVPSLMGVSLNGNTARNMWTAAGFSAGNFNKDENNGTIQRVVLIPGSCSTASVTVHNHP